MTELEENTQLYTKVVFKQKENILSIPCQTQQAVDLLFFIRNIRFLDFNALVLIFKQLECIQNISLYKYTVKLISTSQQEPL